MKVKSPSHVQLLATPWTAAYQAPPSMGFSRQEYWSRVPLPYCLLFSWFFFLCHCWLFVCLFFGPITASVIRDQTHVPWSRSLNQSPKPWTPGISHHCLLFMSSFHTSCIHTCVIFHRWNCAMHAAIFFLSLCHGVL